MPHSVNKLTVLYVDDESLARKYFTMTAGADYDVLTAHSVSAALDILADPRYSVDIIVTDYRMPGQNGAELLRQVDLDYPHVVRVLVTAYAEKNILLETINQGQIFRILEKPIDQAALRSVLRDAAERARERIARNHNMMAIEETLAFLAHELNTPLATIANFARGIRRRGDACPITAEELAESATAMHDNARYCLSVLSTFVDSVRRAATQGPGRIAGHSSTAAKLVGTLLDTYPLTPEQRANVTVDVRQDFEIGVLPNCVALVLSSVLNNAMRAVSGVAQPAVRFTVQAEPQLQIVVHDNGPGIQPHILEKLMVDPVTGHADNGGSGWGLIFCNRIMQSFGGSIEVCSEAGRSTTVALTFPAIAKD